MYSTRSLLYQMKVRRHEKEKNNKQLLLTAKFQHLFELIFRHTEQFSIGVAAVTYVGTASNELAAKMLGNPFYISMSRSNLFNDAIRFMGFNILKLVKMFVDFSNDVLSSAYSMFTFSYSNNVNSYINQLMGFLWIPCIISIIILGFQLILNSKNRPDTGKIIQNVLIATIIVTGLPALLSTATTITKDFVTANGTTDKGAADQVIAEHLTDYTYIYDWTTMEFPKSVTQPNGKPIIKNTYTGNNDTKYVSMIDINETMRWDNTSANPEYLDNQKTEKWDGIDNDKWEATAKGGMIWYERANINKVCWLCTAIGKTNDSQYGLWHIDSPGWLEYFNDSFFYRYNIDYVPCLVTLAVMAIVIIFTSVKIVRILWELAIYRVLGMFFSMGDLHNGEKIKEIIKAIGGAFLVIIVNSVLLKFFMIYSAWLTAEQINGFVKAVMLIAVGIAVIDGPNLVQKLIGVDAGIRSATGTIGAIYAAGKLAKGVGKAGAKFGSEAAEFGRDVAHKGAAVGGFAAGATANATSAVMDRIQNPGLSRDERRVQRQTERTEREHTQQSAAEQRTREAQNSTIHSAVRESAGANMRNNPNYTSDSVDAYTAAAASVYSGSSADEHFAMGQDAYIANHGEQLIREAAEIQDAAFAAGNHDVSEKDAMTSAFANKHSDQTQVLENGTSDVNYDNATQANRTRIDNMAQSQREQGNTIMSARLKNYQHIGTVAKGVESRDEYRGLTAVQSHTAAAAEVHGRTYHPDGVNGASATPQAVDAYQGNMSAALAHKDEIMARAEDYMDVQKAAGHKINMKNAVAEVVRNESEHDMSYGFDEQYADNIAETLMTANTMETPVQSQTTAREANTDRRNLTGSNSVNQNLGRERQRHDNPKTSTVDSARRGFNAGRSLFGRKKDKK